MLDCFNNFWLFLINLWVCFPSNELAPPPPPRRDGKWVFVCARITGRVKYYIHQPLILKSVLLYKCKDCFSHYRLGRAVGVKLREKLLSERLNLQCHYIKSSHYVKYLFSAGGKSDVSARSILMGTDAPPRVFKKSAANYIPHSSAIIVLYCCLLGVSHFHIFPHRRSPLCVCDMQKATHGEIERTRISHSHHYSKRRRGASLGSLDLLETSGGAFLIYMQEHNQRLILSAVANTDLDKKTSRRH